MAVAHYLEALEWQRDVIRLQTIFGGKNPHPNFLVGGMACAINMDNQITINAVSLAQIEGMIQRARDFVEKVYYPDLLAIASFYKEYAGDRRCRSSSPGDRGKRLFLFRKPGRHGQGRSAH